MQKQQIPLKNSLLLLLAAIIWGIAFVAQSVGMKYVGGFTFNAVRSLIGAVVLIPLIFILQKRNSPSNSASKASGRSDTSSNTVSNMQEKKALIIGGIYLLYKHVISWKIPVIYIATVFILFAVIGRHGMRMPLQEIFAGGVMLGGIFMATDYASSPVTPKGQVIFAVGAGLLTYLIRTFGGYPEGVSYSILIMNCCVPLIERFTEPTIFGALPKTKEAK